jgi:hypothetical protein
MSGDHVNALAGGTGTAVTFIAAMAAGMALQHFVDGRQSIRLPAVSDREAS